jgi:exodeoxyribonuclease V alpha subunit
VEYTRQDLNQITHAYCCSVHKSQGSEFPIVILPVTRSYYRMLRRNLIYTAITRSKQSLILCGEEDALRMGVERADELSRQTTLREKLQETILVQPKTPQNDKEPAEGLSYEEELMQVNPMVGMENLTPYDFMIND